MIFKFKFIEETVLAEEKMMLISEDFKHILTLYLSRCSETGCVGPLQTLCDKVAHKKENTFL